MTTALVIALLGAIYWFNRQKRESAALGCAIALVVVVVVASLAHA